MLTSHRPKKAEGAMFKWLPTTIEAGFEVDAELKAFLLAAIAECDRGEKISAEELLRELQSDE